MKNIVLSISSEIKEATKEFLRVIAIAIIPVLIISLQADNINWKAILLSVVIAGLRATDKWLHERGSKYQIPF